MPIKITAYCLTLFITLSFGVVSADPITEQKLPIINPIDDSAQSPSLSKFMTYFDAIVEKKDFTAVLAFLDPDILNSFGGEGGKVEFVLTWNTNQEELFKTLAQIRRGGGKLTKDFENNERYCMPRMFTDFPDQLDVFTHGVIIGENVPIHIAANQESKVITKLSHAIVGVDDWAEQTPGWQQITLEQGVQAYVASDRIRSPIDYRACFIRNHNGDWRMTLLVAGD